MLNMLENFPFVYSLCSDLYKNRSRGKLFREKVLHLKWQLPLEGICVLHRLWDSF